jgi:hypothetical protein
VLRAIPDLPGWPFPYIPHEEPIMKIEREWLTQRAERAPTADHRNLSTMAAMRVRMAWEKLKREAGEEDEIWAFENPANTRKKLGHHTGYALVRNGKIVKSVVTTSD